MYRSLCKDILYYSIIGAVTTPGSVLSECFEFQIASHISFIGSWVIVSYVSRPYGCFKVININWIMCCIMATNIREMSCVQIYYTLWRVDSIRQIKSICWIAIVILFCNRWNAQTTCLNLFFLNIWSL